MRRGVLFLVALVVVGVVLIMRRKVEGLAVRVHDNVPVTEGLWTRTLRAGSKRRRSKPDASRVAEDSIDRDTGRATWREKVEDRENDHYTEKVKYKDTGEVIVEKDVPLSGHRGYGSAKGEVR